jgi:2-C-methyl-D-erythritol 4-phosphate cytidylyltransferase/2-C-methyl-D-erythritol 2,4-cyclodiphosphate synthase
MRNNIAEMLNISNKNVSIKATTTEKLGFIGRKEGIMAQCLTTISRPI